MEGRASNFKKVLVDFESRLPSADFVAIDTELTGVDLEGEMDSFDDTAMVRLDRNCRIAERYSLIQLGLTLVSQERTGREEILNFVSYNLFAFPYAGNDLIGRDQGFFCQASALQFNAQHNVDFNTWIKDGIPYMSREDERRFKKYYGSRETRAEEKAGLLRLWKSLCARQLPFVVHCPLDLFFLLATFERRPLPRNDPRAMEQMIKQCTPKVIDTAHLHGALGGFKRLALTKFAEDAKARYEEMASNGSVTALKFRLVGETNSRYGSKNDMAHEAGFDSLVTAQLYAYLREISPAQVKEGANRLFLYKSIEYLDLERAAMEGEVGACMFDLSRVTLLVAALDPTEGSDAPRLIANAGHLCKWIDSLHVLVVMRASGGAAVRKAVELAKKVHGVVSWMGFDEWREGEAQKAQVGPEVPDASADASAAGLTAGHGCNGCKDTPAASSESNWSPKFFHSGHFTLSRSRAKLLALSAGMMFILLCVRAELGSGVSRLLKRLRRPVS